MYLRFRDLKPRYGIPFSRQHLRRLIKAGVFPEPVYLAPGSIAWLEEDIVGYNQRVRAERDARQSARGAALGSAGDGDACAP